jgi:hypothetical protein
MESISAGGVFEPPAPKEEWTARLSVRLAGLDSSNAWRISVKSSVAEMMGKSRDSKQESARVACSDLKRGCRSQKQKASGISSSQHRLSSSSNVYSLMVSDAQKTTWVNLKPGLKLAYGVIIILIVLGTCAIAESETVGEAALTGKYDGSMTRVSSIRHPSRLSGGASFPMSFTLPMPPFTRRLDSQKQLPPVAAPR